jgi:hypothetical protein
MMREVRDIATDRKGSIANVYNGRIQASSLRPVTITCASLRSETLLLRSVGARCENVHSTMVSVVDSSIADKALASLEEIFLRSELPIRARNGTTEGSPDPVQEGADKSVNDLRAFVTPDTAGEIGIALGALKHPIKVGGRKI